VHTDRVVVELPVPDEDGIDALYAPRRTLLDPVLADAAVEAGAEVRFDTPVEGVLRDPEGRVVGVAYRTPGGGRIEARAPITVGADGVRSLVAREVDAPRTLAGSHASCAAWAYFEGDGFDGYRWFFRSEGAAGVIPTDGGMLVYAALPAGRFADDLRPDVEAGFWRSLRRAAPEAVEAIGPRARTSRFHLHAGVVGFHRRCHGPGWVLVGDASHHKDPLSAHGLTDALRDAELLARAVGPHLDDPAGLDAATAAYEARRDELSRPLFDVVDRLASHRWTPDEVMGLLVAMSSHTGEELAAIRGLDADRTSDSARARIPAGT
jgi:2-polyprenyl-6-methoxyphenol hydroxylase-like FAD-dependent oxidoreductase